MSVCPDKDKEQQEFIKKKQLVIDKIKKEAYGKDYSGINKLTIPMYNWVSSEYPAESDRFKRVVDATLQRLKNELMAEMPLSTPVQQDDYPFL